MPQIGLRIAASNEKDLFDIYDGEVFQKKYKNECFDFLKGEIDYVPIYLAMNCDGFCPFSRKTHSSWNFIFKILNLPRGICFKKVLC
jgi:hypothetical protein